MIDSILWYQPADLSQSDIIIRNGEILPSSVARNEAFDELFEVSKKAAKYSSPWQGNFGEVHFVKGSLNAVDEKGRFLSFMFAAPRKNWKSELNKALKVIGYSMSDETKSCVEKKNAKGVNKALFATLAIIAIVIIVAVVLLCNYYINN